MLSVPLATPILLAFIFAAGAAVGSFLNVCIHRLPEDESVVRPRSRCPRCRRAIAWYDNVPIVSWLLLRARCRGCGQPIPVRYPLVEILAGLLAVLALYRLGPTPQGLGLRLHRRAPAHHVHRPRPPVHPRRVSLPGVVVGLAAARSRGVTLADAVIGAVAGGGVLWALAWTYERATGIESGDVQLLALIGAFVGWQGLPIVLLVASITGSLAGVALILSPRGRAGVRRVRRTLGHRAVVPFLRRLGRRTEIPFGPFLALGAVVVLYVPSRVPPWPFMLAP
jgi:leader peptidase (prepilin peptidase)/N-methyltransferase